MEELARKLGAPGDFAQAYVIAHKIGQRVAWFRHGFRTGRLAAGDTFDDKVFRRVDPGPR